jgi:hypothetical protein
MKQGEEGELAQRQIAGDPARILQEQRIAKQQEAVAARADAATQRSVCGEVGEGSELEALVAQIGGDVAEQRRDRPR